MRFLAVLALLFALAAATNLLPLRTNEKREEIARADNPCEGSDACGPGETCCVLAGNRAGCCPAANACCCPDQQHCCQSPYECTCSGTCPGDNCSCTNCGTTGQCQSNLQF